MATNKKFIKTVLINAALLVIATIIFGACNNRKDAVKNACKANKEKGVDKDVAEFLVKSADARMMDTYEGKLAVEKGTTTSIKEYGQLMVTDQATLMAEIKKLASNRNITLPEQISNKKECYREMLAKKEGKDFDKKFLKMITIDHERDIKLFKEASGFKDAEVSAFAQKFLPMIQTHLDKVNTVKNAPEYR